MAEHVGPLSVLLDRPCVVCQVRLRDHTAEQAEACCERVEGWLRPAEDSPGQCAAKHGSSPVWFCVLDGGHEGAHQDDKGYAWPRSTDDAGVDLRNHLVCHDRDCTNAALWCTEHRSVSGPGDVGSGAAPTRKDGGTVPDGGRSATAPGAAFSPPPESAHDVVVDASPGHVICPVCEAWGTRSPIGADGCGRCGEGASSDKVASAPEVCIVLYPARKAGELSYLYGVWATKEEATKEYLAEGPAEKDAPSFIVAPVHGSAPQIDAARPSAGADELLGALREVLEHYHAPCPDCWDVVSRAAKLVGYVRIPGGYEAAVADGDDV